MNKRRRKQNGIRRAVEARRKDQEEIQPLQTTDPRAEVEKVVMDGLQTRKTG